MENWAILFFFFFGHLWPISLFLYLPSPPSQGSLPASLSLSLPPSHHSPTQFLLPQRISEMVSRESRKGASGKRVFGNGGNHIGLWSWSFGNYCSISSSLSLSLTNSTISDFCSTQLLPSALPSSPLKCPWTSEGGEGDSAVLPFPPLPPQTYPPLSASSFTSKVIKSKMQCGGDTSLSLPPPPVYLQLNIFIWNAKKKPFFFSDLKNKRFWVSSQEISASSQLSLSLSVLPILPCRSA